MYYTRGSSTPDCRKAVSRKWLVSEIFSGIVEEIHSGRSFLRGWKEATFNI